uniref:(northern house mosquito) hypothetical protein n=1 Tax=Culex pipiens TaxID=7175 RepID=A0A8D8EWA6_CULPI
MVRQGGLSAVRDRVCRRSGQRVAFPVPVLQKWRRCFPRSLWCHAGGRWHSPVLHGARVGSVQSEGCHHLLGPAGSPLQRNRLRGRADRVLRGLLLQRDHRVVAAVLFRVLHGPPAVDPVQQRMEHGPLQAVRVWGTE